MTNVHVTTAMPLSDAMRDKVEAWLNAKYGQYTVKYHLDESLLGGIVIFDGDTVYDGSIKSKLKGLEMHE